jgi:hypothetical protein
MEIKKLKDRNSEPDADTVAVLEEALEMAKSGRLRSVALAGNLTGHATYTNYTTRDLQEAIGLVGFLHHTLCAKQSETPAS